MTSKLNQSMEITKNETLDESLLLDTQSTTPAPPAANQVALYAPMDSWPTAQLYACVGCATTCTPLCLTSATWGMTQVVNPVYSNATTFALDTTGWSQVTPSPPTLGTWVQVNVFNLSNAQSTNTTPTASGITIMETGLYSVSFQLTGTFATGSSSTNEIDQVCYIVDTTNDGTTLPTTSTATVVMTSPTPATNVFSCSASFMDNTIEAGNTIELWVSCIGASVVPTNLLIQSATLTIERVSIVSNASTVVGLGAPGGGGEPAPIRV